MVRRQQPPACFTCGGGQGKGLYWGYIGVILGLCWGYIGVILGLCWGYRGIVEEKMETTIL